MRKIEMLYNKANELHKEYEQKVREMNIAKWDTNKLVNSIISYYEYSDDVATASRAFLG